MINKVNELIDKTSDKIMLQTLKLEITEKNANIDEILNRYLDEYKENNIETTKYNINFGHNKNLKDYKQTLDKIKPCSSAQNYNKTNIKAKGNWKTIYEIAFGNPDIVIITKKPADKKTKQIKFKETV